MATMVKKLLTYKGVLLVILLMAKGYLHLVRIKFENERVWQDHSNSGGAVLLCAFHQQFLPLIRDFSKYRNYNPCVMISQSRDGDIISWIARQCSWGVIRGSSSRGGKTAMENMIGHMKEGGIGANIVDGPTGPIGKVKAGTIRMAQKASAAIVPILVTAEAAWHVNSWDRFMVPKPFSTVTIKFGDLMFADEKMGRNEFERARQHLETLMAPYLY